MSVKRVPLRQQIKETVVGRILDGTYASGERLVEMRLAQEFGTSQAPVREALRELEAIGFVSSTAHRGTFVRDFWQHGLSELYLVRGSLEETATRAAMPLGRNDLKRLEGELEGMREAARRHDLDGVCRHSVAFHAVIMKAAGNELLFNVWNSLQIDTRTTVAVLTRGFDLADVAESHVAIVESIRSGDVEEACRVAREHQAHFERLHKAARDRKLGAAAVPADAEAGPPSLAVN